MSDDFVIGIEIAIQDNGGNEIDNVGSWVLSDKTMQMIIEDVAEYLSKEV
jgi:hypothetical protein